MSVAPDAPSNLPERRRPSSIAGGLGKDPAWVIDEADLGPDLCYYPDANGTRHGVIGPVRAMTRRLRGSTRGHPGGLETEYWLTWRTNDDQPR